MRLRGMILIGLLTSSCGDADPKPNNAVVNNINNANNGNNTNNTNNSNNANNTNANNSNNTQLPSDEFQAVFDHFTQTCAMLACHGAASNNTMTVAANQLATPMEVFEALRSTTPTADGQLLIVPNDPTASNVISRMSLPNDDTLRAMPQGEGSSTEEIEIFIAWIEAGATF